MKALLSLWAKSCIFKATIRLLRKRTAVLHHGVTKIGNRSGKIGNEGTEERKRGK